MEVKLAAYPKAPLIYENGESNIVNNYLCSVHKLLNDNPFLTGATTIYLVPLNRTYWCTKSMTQRYTGY